MGGGDAFGPPHPVGNRLLDATGLEASTPESYAYTYLDLDAAALTCGRTGGFTHLETLLDMLRDQACGRRNNLTPDGGDLWQGSGTSLGTRGVDMVDKVPRLPKVNHPKLVDVAANPGIADYPGKWS